MDRKVLKSKKITGENTREKILQVSLNLFASNGYYKTSITQIVKHSGTYRAAIEWYFGSKLGLLVALLDEYLEKRLINDLKSLWINNTKYFERFSEEEALHRLHKNLVRFMNKHEGTLMALFTLTFEQIDRDSKPGHKMREVWAKITDTFEWMIQTRAEILNLNPLIDKKLLARIMLANCQGAFIQYHMEPTPENAQRLFEQLIHSFRFLYFKPGFARQSERIKTGSPAREIPSSI